MRVLKKILIELASLTVVPSKYRIKIYNFCGMKLYNKDIWGKCTFLGTNVQVGKGTWINRECFIDSGSANVYIGENCGIGMQVMFCTNYHEIGDSNLRAGKTLTSDIVVEDGCWIGARTTILPGVKVGKGCIIAAGSVVIEDCKPDGLYAGVPAVRKKDLKSKF